MRRTVVLLGASQALEYAAQLVLPVLLVRLLSPEEFGGYRIAWLLAQTSVAALTLNLAHNLIYQAALQPAERRAALVGNAVVFLFLAGAVAVLLLGTSGVVGRLLGGHTLVLPFIAAFLLFWLMSQPLDSVALMIGRPLDQARLALCSTACRVGVVAAAAFVTRSLDGVLLAMALVAALRLVLLFGYARHTIGTMPRFDASLLRWQLTHAFGLGLGASLFVLRMQIDGWLAALMFDATAVALIAIAASVAPVVGVVRAAFTHAVLPAVSQAVAQGRLEDALSLNRRVNVQVAAAVAPIAFCLLILAPEVVTLVFTSAYEAAVAPSRLYLIAYAVAIVETTTLIQSLGYGRFVLMQGALLLSLSAAVGLAGAHLVGLTGIAMGTLVSACFGALLNMRLLVRRHGVSWRRIQDWPLLLRVIAASALAAAAAAALLSSGSMDVGPWLRLAAGGACFAVVWGIVIASDDVLRALYQGALRRPLSAAA